MISAGSGAKVRRKVLMYAPCPEIPIEFLEEANPEVRRHVRTFAYTLQRSVIEAAIVLDLFNRAVLEEAALAPPGWFDHDPIFEEAVKQVVLPRDRPELYFKIAPQLHARTFVITLRMVGVFISEIIKIAGPAIPDLKRISSAFDADFPSLKALRDSIAHMDERIRGLTRGRQIPLTSIPGIAEGGGVLINGMLRDGSLGWTAADGSYVECEISEATLTKAAQHVEQLIAALS